MATTNDSGAGSEHLLTNAQNVAAAIKELSASAKESAVAATESQRLAAAALADAQAKLADIRDSERSSGLSRKKSAPVAVKA